jgi:hypothetical protein
MLWAQWVCLALADLTAMAGSLHDKHVASAMNNTRKHRTMLGCLAAPQPSRWNLREVSALAHLVHLKCALSAKLLVTRHHRNCKKRLPGQPWLSNVYSQSKPHDHCLNDQETAPLAAVPYPMCIPSQA